MTNVERHDTCPDCGADIVHRHGKYGSFVGCSNFPHCRWTSSEEDWDACDGDPDKWKFDRLMEEAEAEATNPNN